MATIVVISGPSQGQTFPLEANRLVSIGRDDQCTFQVSDEQVSRRHLQIRFDAQKDRHFAVDIRSANGVFVNGARLTEERMLDEGDVIRIGETELRYTEDNLTDVDAAMQKYRNVEAWKRGTAW